MANSSLDPGLIHAKIYNIENLLVKWGEAAGPFLSIEPLMRYIGELHEPFRDKVKELIKSDRSTKNSQYIHYWDCNPKYLIEAIKSLFSESLSPEAIAQICKYPALRDKFLHGNFIALMENMELEPSGRILTGNGQRNRLEPGEIYESFLSMERNNVFGKLRLYSAEVTKTLKEIIRSIGSRYTSC